MLVLLLFTGLLHAATDKNLWPKWVGNNPLSNAVISHQAWDKLLKKHVITNEEGINLINYHRFDKEDLNTLKNYIKEMSNIDIGNYNRREQLAYWINLYNALAVQTVINYHPVATIQQMDVAPGLFSIGPVGKNLIEINNTMLNLDDINNRIIRPIWNDPRTLYALNNATIGAANLSNCAYRGATLDNQLNAAASAYINSLRGVEVIEGKLVLSKIFEWYKDDFGETSKDVVQHLEQFAKEPLLSQLKHINTIDSYIYNWHLNGLSGK
ncbi:MAG: DUF547 domain-containing protein [Legionellales bacterium]